MTLPQAVLDADKVIVSDFDGTMTEHDFYLLAIERLLPPGAPDYWSEYRAGTITHFEGLARYFAAIREPEERVREIVRQMGVDPGLAGSIRRLREAGWEVVIASAGCAWYIRQLLGEIDVPVFANPGRFVEGAGLVMEMPEPGPFRSENLGVDKTAIVRFLLDRNKTVAFAGDGFPDAGPARLVPDALRFARGDLANVLAQERKPFHPYRQWSDIVPTLTK